MSPREFIIYGLVDPRTEEVRYIGKSSRGMTRPWLHLCPSNLRGESHKERWIRAVMADGLKPKIVVLQRCASVDELDAAEEQVITDFRSRGAALTNATPGGKGKPLGCASSEETRKKISAALTGRRYGSRERIRGENHPKRRFDENDVIFVRELRMKGATQQMLADFFGVSQACIFSVCSGKTWRHVGGPVGKFIHNVKRVAL